MKKLLFLCILIFCAQLFAKDSIQFHLASFPSHADVYIGERPSSFVSKASYETPTKILLEPHSSSIFITLFKENYRDTTIQVHIKANENNEAFLMVMLQSETNETQLAKQSKILNKRKKKKWAKRLFWATVPASILSISQFFIFNYHTHQVEQYSEKIDRTLIRNHPDFKGYVKKTKHHTHHAKNFRTATLLSSGGTLLLLGAGITFSF